MSATSMTGETSPRAPTPSNPGSALKAGAASTKGARKMPYARLLGRKGNEFCPKDVDVEITSIPAFIGKADLHDSIGFERMGNRVTYPTLYTPNHLSLPDSLSLLHLFMYHLRCRPDTTSSTLRTNTHIHMHTPPGRTVHRPVTAQGRGRRAVPHACSYFLRRRASCLRGGGAE